MSKINKEQIIDALKRSGYLLENRILDVLSKAEYGSYPNLTYPDSQTRKSREIDIYSGSPRFTKNIELNHHLHFELNANLIIESSNNPQPIAFFKRPDDTKETIFGKFLFTKTETPTIGNIGKSPDFAFNEFTVDSDKFHYNNIKKNTQYCSFSPKKGKKDEWLASHPNGLHDTFNKLLDCSLHVRKNNENWLKQSPYRNQVYLTMYYPIIVVEGEIIEVQENGEDVEFENTEHILFEFNRNDENSNTILIDVITESYLPTLIELINKDITEILNMYVAHYTDQKIENPMLWNASSEKLDSDEINKRFKAYSLSFLDSVEGILDQDWEHTNSCLRDENINFFIKENGSFLFPEVEDVGNNWGNRPGFIYNYRKLKEFILENHIDSRYGDIYGIPEDPSSEESKTKK